MYIINKHWTNSNGIGGIDTTLFNDYGLAMELFEKLKKEFYEEYNPLIIVLKDGKYYEHKCNDEVGYTDEFIIENFNEKTIYDYLQKSNGNEFMIHKINTKGEYEEHELSQEGWYKRPSGLEFKIFDMKEGVQYTTYKLPFYRTYF